MNGNVTGEGAEAAVKKKHCNFRLFTVTLEPRHENKNCSTCLKDQLKPFLNFILN